MAKGFDDQPIFRNTSAADVWDIDAGLRTYMIRVYSYMALGLGLTGIVAFITASSPAFFHAIFGTPLAWLVMLAPVGMALFLSFRIVHLPLSTAQILFWAYAALMGVSLSTIFYVYTGQSIARLFFVAASVFGAMSLYGYTTRKNLMKFGSFLMMGVIGIFVSSIVNLFLQSTGFQFIISIVGVLVFTGLTAYDTQAIKELYYEADSTEIAGKKAIIGALNLYLDFINLFIHLLRIFGDRR